MITSGGVSVGQKDYLPTVLEMLHAESVFAGVAQKPGSPMIAAQVREKLVFCLSGNPFAAAATLEQYAVPALLRAAGRREEDCIPVHTRGRLTTGFSKPSKGNPLSAGQSAGRPGGDPRRGQRGGAFLGQSVGHDGLQLPGGAACGQRPGGSGRRSGGTRTLYSEKKQALAAELSLKRPAVLAVSGAHNSGKTTLLEKLIPLPAGTGPEGGCHQA